MNAMKKLICLLLMLCAGTAAFAWGGREHRLIAYIAEAHLTPRTRQVLDRYLDQAIVEYSTWMDRYRTAPGYEITTYWHMVTIDKDGSVPPEPLRPNGDGKAMRVNAALRLDSDTRDWFRFDNRGRMSGAEAIVVETSTEGVEGRGLSFDFSFLAGNHDINRSWGYPVEWKVEYSADGLPFIDAGRIFVLRPVVYNDAVIKDLGLRRLSYDAALGFTEYSVPLPVSLLGHKRLTVRLTPASAVMATIPENPADDSAGGVVTADFRQPFVLRLGRVAVRALR